MRGFVLLGANMKAIQFKKTDCPISGMSDNEVMREFGGIFEFEGRGQGERITTFRSANGQEKLVRLGDWILEIDGMIVVLNNEEYQLLQSEQKLKEIKDRIDSEIKQYQHRVQTGLIKPQTEQPKYLGQIIGDSVKAVIKKEQSLFSGLLAGNKFAEGGYIKPPYIIEMEHQINALSMTISALSCRIEVLGGGK